MYAHRRTAGVAVRDGRCPCLFQCQCAADAEPRQRYPSRRRALLEACVAVQRGDGLSSGGYTSPVFLHDDRATVISEDKVNASHYFVFLL